MPDGSLQYVISLDNAQALAALERFNATADRMAAKIDGIRTTAGSAATSTGSFFDSIAHAGSNVANTVAGVKALGEAISWLKGAQVSAAAGAQAASVANTALSASARGARTAVVAGASGLGLFGGAAVGAAASVGILTAAMAVVLPAIIAINGAMAAVGVVTKGIGLANTAEQTAIAFKTLTGNATAAASVVEMISQMAIDTPFQEAELQGAARTLLAARVPAGALKQEMKALGNVAAATNGDIGRLATVYGQVAGKGKLYAEEMQQFVEQGAGEIRQAVAETMGVTTAQAMQMMQDGQVGFSVLQQAMQDLAGESGKFNGAMEAQSKTNIGLLSSLGDNISKIMKMLGAPIADGPIKAFLSTAVTVSQTVGQVMAAAIAKGEIKETIMNAVILGAKLGVNGFITVLQNLGNAMANWAKGAVSLIQGIMTGSAEAIANAAVALASFDWDKGLFDTTAQDNYFKNLISNANQASAALKKPAENWAKEMDSTEGEDSGDGSGSGTGKGKSKKPTAYTDTGMALPLIPSSAAEAARMLKDVPEDQRKGLPMLPTDVAAARKVLEKPIPKLPTPTPEESAEQPTNPAAAVMEALAPTVTASSAAPAVPAGPTATVTGALARGASVAAAAAKEPAKMRGYSFRAQGGADAARSRADLARYQRQDHLYSPQAVFPGRPGAAADAVQTAVGGGQGGDSTAATSKPDTSGQVAAKLDEIKAELVRIRTE